MADAASTMFVSDSIEAPASPAGMTAAGAAARYRPSDARAGAVDVGLPRVRDPGGALGVARPIEAPG